MPHKPSQLIRKQASDKSRMHDAAIAALQIAAEDMVGQDDALQLEKIAEWIKRADARASDPDSSSVQ
jgi:hypothetical protein